MKISTNQERLNELFDADPRNDTAIAERLHVSKQALSSWRKGVRSPKKSVLIQISKMYNVSLEWLMGFDVPKNGRTIDLQLFNGYPSPAVSETATTCEARIISSGVDKMPPDKRAQALKILQVAFSEYADLFKEDTDNDT